MFNYVVYVANIDICKGGHCKSLAPHYEKAAKNLKGIAKVAAVDCDEEKNKAFCGSQGVQGFPTLKIFKPSSKKGKPIVEGKFYRQPRNLMHRSLVG